jgi:hypothetical protein
VATATKPSETETAETETAETETAETAGETKRTRTRTPMPFGRSFGVTVKFHNDLPDKRRNDIVSSLLGTIENLTSEVDGKGNQILDVHRSTRGEPNPNLQTWLVAKDGYSWPESTDVERGVRIPKGPLADALRAYASQHSVSIEEAAAKFAEAFNTPASE